ncbi:MAG: NAD-dependent epimerase/dehydratase family protein [Gemmatimonadota bacterium]
MPTTRRSFLHTATTAAGALALGGVDHLAATSRHRGLPDVPAAPRALRILILGGTGFTGPFQVAYAVARGHHVTVFNRGRRQTELPEGVVHLQGDRNLSELDALRGQRWDVVIDNPTTLPFWIRDAAEVLRDSTGQYVMISTISVYDPAGQSGITEDSPLMEYTGGDPLAVTPEQFQQNVGGLYGPMKAASERETLKAFGERATIIRPGLIVGPRDGSFRFTYWPYRIAQGGQILAPGYGTDPIQIIDARDLAEWTVRMVEDGHTGIYNATGPAAPMTMAEQLHGIRAAFPGNDPDLRFTWVPADFLADHRVSPWGNMPTWIPASSEGHVISKTDNTRARARGLTFRPLATTAVDALVWFQAQPEEAQAAMTRQAGLPPEREAAVLAAWGAAG